MYELWEINLCKIVDQKKHKYVKPFASWKEFIPNKLVLYC